MRSELISNQILSQNQNLYFESINFLGAGNAKIFFGIKPMDILNFSMDQLIEKVCNFKIVSHSEYSNVKMLISAVIAGSVTSLIFLNSLEQLHFRNMNLDVILQI